MFLNLKNACNFLFNHLVFIIVYCSLIFSKLHKLGILFLSLRKPASRGCVRKVPDLFNITPTNGNTMLQAQSQTVRLFISECPKEHCPVCFSCYTHRMLFVIECTVNFAIPK